MGWNNVSIVRKHPVLDGVGDNSCFYFVHSYYPVPTDKSYVLGETRYADTTFASVIGKGSLVVTQFHPEKSGKIGLKLLENFVKWNPGR